MREHRPLESGRGGGDGDGDWDADGAAASVATAANSAWTGADAVCGVGEEGMG